MSVSPIREDFIGDLVPPEIKTLNSLNNTIKVVGSGNVEWTKFDVEGVTRTTDTCPIYS
jgi:hypothetical protein